MQMMNIFSHQPILKNVSQKLKRQVMPFYPYKTQNFRLKYIKKQSFSLIKRPEQQQNQQDRQKNIKSRQKNQVKSILRRNQNNQVDLCLKAPILFNKLPESSMINGDGQLSFELKLNLKKPRPKQSNNSSQLPNQQPQISSQKQKKQTFRKTFCATQRKNYKNISLQIRRVQKKPPSLHKQTHRPSTRIRKILNIGQENNDNFLAKYQIIKQLGKGTYGTVYLAKVIDSKSNKTTHLHTQRKDCQNEQYSSPFTKQKLSQTQESIVQNKQVTMQSQNCWNSGAINTLQTKNGPRDNDDESETNLNIKNQKRNDGIILKAGQLQSSTKHVRKQTILRIAEEVLSNVEEQLKCQIQKDQRQITNQSKGELNLQKEDSHQRIQNERCIQREQLIQNEQLIQKEQLINNEQLIPKEQGSGDQLVAIKVYQKFKMNKDPAKFKNIRKQITVMQNLKHQGVIKLYESVESLTKICLVVQFGGQHSLIDYLKMNFPLSQDKIKHFSRQLLDILVYLHQKNIVHRDIKPHNILIRTSVDNPNLQQLKLIDYGFSTLTNKSRKLNVICGTPNFMAPELLRSEQYFGQKADVWSYGVVVFVMAEGRHPFKSSHQKQLERLVNKGNYSFKRTHHPSFQKFIANILKVDGLQRPTALQVSKLEWLQD